MNEQIHAEQRPLAVDNSKTGLDEVEPELTNEEPVKTESNGKQAVRYVLWGSISVVVNFITFVSLNHVLHVNYQVANLIACIIGVQVGFWIDREIVFRHKSNSALREMAMFYATRVVTYFVEAGTLWIGVSLLSGDATVTKVCGQVLALTGNFLFSKLVIFKNKVKA
ncbi:GtrA family protein [Companilactobacillus mishanensis]|uniref:GtrA family protein n=1 Tax=Companilactobacillus mishanensis TaxID=2486008 RepID=A0ABW9P8J6_9LACO|nr:GtrA family protein [Companilactobacillus mishanensis]MQS45551.1 GtrA family protein [Companilactobacillus mishanensis]